MQATGSKGRSDAVRELVIRDYIQPARVGNRRRFAITQGELKAKMVELGFPARNANQIGTSIEADFFLKNNGLRLCSPKSQSRKNEAVYEFEFVDTVQGKPAVSTGAVETPEQRAERLLGRLLGLMKDEIAAHGGTEGYMRWVRSDDEDEGAVA